MTQNTLTDLRSMEQAADDGKDRYFLGLCTLFVATIEDAKDRISQLELVFCSQLFPAFQAKLVESCQAAQAAEILHHHALQEWESSREALLCELHELRTERDSHLQGQETLHKTTSGEIHELRQELLGLRQEKELRAEEETQWKLQLQEQETLRRKLSGEVETLQQELQEFRQEKDLRAEGESQRKIHQLDDETLCRDEERLLRQKDSMRGDFEKMSAEATELLRSNGKLRQENLDLRQHCLKLSSELGVLKWKMQSSSYGTSPNVAETEAFDAQGLQFKLDQKSQERSLTSFRRQLLSAEVEKEKKATHAALVKLHDLKKRYGSLRKQYSVLFRQSHPLGQRKQAEIVAICEKQVASGHGDTRVETYPNTNVRESKRKCSWRKAGKYIGTPSGSNLSRKIGDVNKSAGSAPSLDHRDVSVNSLSVSAMNAKNQKRQVVEADGLSRMVQICGEVNVVGNCSSPTSPDFFQSLKSADEEIFAEDDRAEKNEDDVILNIPQGLANSEKSAFGKKFSPLKEKLVPGRLSEQKLDCNDVIHLDKASQIGSCNNSLSKVAEFECGPSCDALVEGTESCNSGENNQDSHRPPEAFAPLEGAQGVNIAVRGDPHRPTDNGWFPVQKRALPSNSHPEAVKSLKTTWRNTRSRAVVNGFDPHDDFLDTPHENVLKSHADQAVNNHHRINALNENGILTNSFQNRGGLKPPKTGQEEPVNCGGGKDVSFSQITTQEPESGAGFDDFANQNQQQSNEQTHLQPSGSNHNMPRPRKHGQFEQKIKPLGGDDKNKHSSSAIVRTNVPSASKQGPMYKYVEPVRKKDEREKLQGVECNQCKKFYDAVLTNNGSGAVSARCEHHNAVSRHRYRYVPPSTPEGFWNIGFDSDL